MTHFPIIADRIAMMNLQFLALENSATSEYHLTITTHHARGISRIGFVTQDMMDLQSDVLLAIRNRANEIGDNSTECIQDAELGLTSAATIAGEQIMLASRAWYEEVNLLNDDLIAPLIGEIEFLNSVFDFEVLAMFAIDNPVTQLELIVNTMYELLDLYSDLFEFFVTDLLVHFVTFETLSGEKNGRIFQQLDNALDTFSFSANLIRNSLETCNE